MECEYVCVRVHVWLLPNTFLPPTKRLETKGDSTPVINILAGGWEKQERNE